MNANEPVAWFEQDPDMKSIWYQSDQDNPIAIPLYTHPVKYCPSEDNAAYEKGFIDGMAKMTESAVHRAVEGMATIALTEEEVMAKYCTCYKLGYSALNNYTKVEDELLTKGEVK